MPPPRSIHTMGRGFYFFLNITKTTYSRRRSVSIAALSAGSSTPSSLATCPHRIARRLDLLDTGHAVQTSTSRSSFTGRCFAAHLWQAVRSLNKRVCITKTCPVRNHAWKWRVEPSGSCISTIVAVFNNCCNVSPRSAVRETAYARAYPWRPMASQPRLAPALCLHSLIFQFYSPSGWSSFTTDSTLETGNDATTRRRLQ